MLDENGYPGTKQSDGSYDGGDTAAILGTLWFFGQFLKTYLPMVNGKPVRHPDQSKWYGQTDRFSRDQLVAVLCGHLGSSKLQMPLGPIYDLYKAHKARFFLTAWNTKKNGAMDVPNKAPDLTGPEVWSLWLRIYKPSWAKLVLPILDVELLVGAIHWRFFRKDRVTRNHLLSSLASRKNNPTLVSKLADKINNYPDLVQRWEDHCAAVGEYQTANLFKDELNIKDVK